ncbi:MAG: hypothetical protein AAFU49_22715 [Pseudomonadota bacterium]
MGQRSFQGPRGFATAPAERSLTSGDPCHSKVSLVFAPADWKPPKLCTTLAAAEAVPVTGFTGLTIRLTQNKIDPATLGSFPDTLIQFDGPAAGGPASAIIGPGIAIEDVVFFQA